MPNESNRPTLNARTRIRRFLQWVRIDRIRAERYAPDETPVPRAPPKHMEPPAPEPAR